MSTTRYKYAPLHSAKNEIRLLHMDKGLHGKSRTYSLHHVSLDEKPEYVALSYCWGRQGPDRPIAIGGSRLLITRSLETALQNIDSHHPLWIDAVCINQNDSSEKTWQVQLMRKIYNTASEVIIWLGHSTDATDVFLSGVNELSKKTSSHGLLEVDTPETEWVIGMDVDQI
ncbi:hypothetical protein E8E11_011974 [Didymella keratinophila]|nr:hypothetical protein E8E11_011974 [Didymella keratinophila]